MPDEKMKPTEPPPEMARPALAVLFLCALIAASVWILRPFLPALIWATMVVIATWPLLLRVQQRLGNRRTPAVIAMTLLVLLVLIVPSVAGDCHPRRQCRSDRGVGQIPDRVQGAVATRVGR
jgi:predicted PurR-regulated permease PerM